MKHRLGKSERIRLTTAFLVVMILLSGIFVFVEGRMYYQRRENKLYLAANQSQLIEGSLSEVMSRVYTLRALVKADGGDTTFFEGEIPEIYEETIEDTGLYVKNFILAPGGVVEKIYPQEGNEDLIGFDFLNQNLAGNEDAKKAYEENRLVLTEPFSLKQGGNGIAGRLPVYLTGADREKEFWGMVSVTLDMEYLLKQFNLSYLEETGTAYRLWYTAENGEQIVLAQSEHSPKDPIFYEINPHNLTWTLEVAPVDGWIPVRELAVGAVLILGISFLILKLLEGKAKIQTMNVLLEEIAIRDNLTGCYSRHYVNVMLLIPGTQDWKDPEARYSLAVVDVDRFKQINDRFGHGAGDRALTEVAKVLQSLCDELRGDCVIRYGGDEFVFLMNHVTRELFEQRLGEMLKGVRAIVFSDIPELKLTVSVGAAMGNGKETYFELFSRADKLVYLSKENGKDQYHIEPEGGDGHE